LIYRIAYAKKPKQALLTAPCFFEYEAALTAAGCSIVYHTLLPQEGYRVTKTLLDAIQSRIDILFLCQPNNPTGLTIEGALMLEILNRCRQKQVMLVADECFVDFLSDPKAYSLCEQMEHNKNLIVLKAFTKFYGMAGLRLGYALGYDEELLKAMREAGQPWNVSSVAQAAGIAALQDDAYALKVRNLINTERPKMIRALKSLGLKCLPSAANFIFFTCEDIYLEYKLKKAGIMIRSCADYRACLPEVTALPSENRRKTANFLRP
jgi:threonine-phosphate decarboxylase